jgi:hypothetical protein
MRVRVAALGLACAGLFACAMPAFGPEVRSLAEARQACNRQYPRRVGLYLPHAQCVNAAIEQFAIPTARYPDLVRLQERARSELCEQIDSRRISPRSGEHRMAEADRLIAEAERSRDVADRDGAARKLAAVEAMLR